MSSRSSVFTQQLPRPEAPVPPETPPRQGTSDNATEPLEPMSDNACEEEVKEQVGQEALKWGSAFHRELNRRDPW